MNKDKLITDLLRMAWTDGRRYGQGNTDINFDDHINSIEYQEAIKLLKRRIMITKQEFKKAQKIVTNYILQELSLPDVVDGYTHVNLKETITDKQIFSLPANQCEITLMSADKEVGKINL